jgi:adenylate cyclase
MGKEIERKFLVKGEFRHLATKKIEILQAYLVIDPAKTVRIRISDDKAYLTIKGRSAGFSFGRDEWEFQIPSSDANDMLKLCLPGKIIKTRHLVPSGAHIIEVDVFHDKNEGLVIAEIELDSESEKYEKPDWLGEEVTGNPAYYNANLIK